MTRRYHFRNIRALLTEGFNYEDLRRFCYDEPPFRPVYDELAPETGKTAFIDQLIEYADQRSLLESLLTLVKDLNPARYEQHQPYADDTLSFADLDTSEVAAYLATVAEAHRYLPREGFDQRILLTEVFVMLQAAQIRPRRDVELTKQRQAEMGLLEHLGWRAKDQAKTKVEPPPPPPVEVATALREHSRLVILGEPGSGKTTLLRFITLCLATNEAETKLKLVEKYLPVFIELRHLSPGETLDQFLFRDLTAAPYHLPPTTIKEWLNEGRLMLLLDALDEVPLEQQAHVREQVERFAASPKWSYNRLILSSRIVAYRESSGLSTDRFIHYTLRPLTGTDSAWLYTQGWLRSLGEMEAEAKAKQLVDYMDKQPGLRRVMSNPLQLRLAVVAYDEGGQGALTNRAHLYRHYLEKSLRQREQARGQTPPWDQVLASLERLAWARHTARAGRLPQTEAIKLLGEGGYERLAYLRQRTGLVVVADEEKGEPLLAFSHQTYQEYLVAHVLCRTWQKGQKQRETVWAILKPRLHHPDWREPILLLVGLLPLAAASDLLRRIRSAHSPYENILHRDLLLALACLADGVKVDETVSGDIKAQSTTLSFTGKVNPPFTLLLRVPFCRVSCGDYPSLKFQIVKLMEQIRAVPAMEPSWFVERELSGDTTLFPEKTRQEPKRYLMRSPASGIQGKPKSSYVIQMSWTLADYLRSLKLGDPTVEPLIVAMGDKDWQVRQAAAEALGKLGDAHAVELLIDTLGDEVCRVRWTAATVLGKLGDARAVKPLIDTLRDEDWRMRQVAAKMLGKLGDARAVEPLITMLGDEDWEVRQAAAEALGELGDARAVEPLIAALRDEDWEVRWKAAETLGRLGDATVEPFIAALRNENKDVRRAAAETLGKLGDARAVESLIAALGDEDWEVRQAAAETLGKLGDARAVEPLIAALRDEDWYMVRWAAAEALGRLGDAAVERLIAALKDENKDMRQAAAEALGRLGDAHAVERLIAALGDEDWEVRQAAVVALGKLGDARVVEPLIAALGDENKDVRLTATVALGELGNARAGEPLIAALGDENKYVRQKAVELLGQLGDTRAVEPLIVALRDENKDVRWTATVALGELGNARAVELLIAALKDEDWEVRRVAIEALGKLAARLTESQGRAVARALWWEATTPDQPDVYEPLLSIATRLVVLEVERLPTLEYLDV